MGQHVRAFGSMIANIRSLVRQIEETGEREKERLDVLVRERTAELAASLERYRTLVENTSAVPWEMDASTLVFTYVSPQATKLFGLSESSLLVAIGRSPLIHPDDRGRLQRELAELAASDDPAAGRDNRVSQHERRR